MGWEIMSQEKVLIVEDEENERTGLAEVVSSWGYRVETAADGLEGWEKVTRLSPTIIVTDLKMPRLGGMELLGRLAESQTSQTIAVIVMTAQGTIDSAVRAMRMGAYDYITKPIDTDRLRTILEKASELLGTKLELEVHRRKLRDSGSLGQLVGASKKMQEIFRLIEMVAPSTASVLITGASGTGKEMVARTIHDLSTRRVKPFVPINCAAIPETLLETELFGYEKGAFTGAGARKPGKFELAHRGTLFLDEIGDLPLALQPKILRALEEKRFERVGGTSPIQVDVRVVAATNRNLKAAVAARQYREDLYFRLSVFPILIPPLRDRPADIVTLARYFIERSCRELNKKALALSETAEQELRAYPWPGNVRELQNCIERAAILTEGDTIHPHHLHLSFRAAPASTTGEDTSPWSKVDLSGTLADVCKRAVSEVERRKLELGLSEASGDVGRAAELLQVSYKTIVAKLKEYGLDGS